MLEQLVGRVFLARDLAHLEHWRTSSFAQHTALGEFYEGAIGILDRFVEASQGKKMLGPVTLTGGTRAAKDPDMATILEAEADWITKNRNSLTEGVPALQNILDDLAGLYLTTVYKLKHLK